MTAAGGRHRGLVSAVSLGLLAVAGLGCVSYALGHQQSATAPAGPALSTGTPSPSADPTSQVVGLVLPRSLPLALTIPAIGVTSKLQQLGQNPDGSLQVPAHGPHYDEAGWYRYSPTPGSLGPSVIVGHVDSAADGPSIFYRLGSLHAHDTILVTRTDGYVAVFRVDQVLRFRKTSFPTRLVYGDTHNAALRLLTCGGPIVGGHYRDNVVVLASLVSAAPTRT